MKRVLAVVLSVTILLMSLGGMTLTAVAQTTEVASKAVAAGTYAVDALSFTAGYASAADGEIDLSVVQTYDAYDTHNLQYTDTYTELSSASGIPYQVFDVDLAGRTSGDVTIYYSGATKDGERIAVKAYNVKTAAWDTIGTFKGTGEVSAALDIATYNDGGKVHVAAILDYVTNGSNMMIWSSDPQHYTEFEDLREYYYTIYQYAAKQYTLGNVGYIFTTGDLVDDVPTSRKAAYQWSIADQAMSYVEAVGMPNGVVTGNHDVNTFNATDYSAGAPAVDYSMFHQTFPASRYENERWYGGSLNNNASHYDLITIGNIDFIIMFLGYGVEATDETIAWANQVLKTYSHRTAIIATHDYLNAQNADYNNRGQLVFNKIVDPNPNVKMVACGHDDGSVCRETVASDGRIVYEVLGDYQEVEAEDPSFYANEHWIGKVQHCCGDGYIRLLTVEGDTLKSVTYSPVTGRYNPFGDIENLTLDLDVGVPDRSMATAVFSAAILGENTTATDVDRVTVRMGANGPTYSAVTYASVPAVPAKTDDTAWPATTYGAAATPSNPFYTHAAKEAPAVTYKTDVLQAVNLGEHPTCNTTAPIGNYALDIKVNLNKTPYLYYSFAQPSNSKFTFAFINDTATAPWITFLDTRKGGATFAYGADAWDAAGDAQYFTTSVTGCIDMRTMISVAGATDWTVTQLNLYSTMGKDVMISYMFFGSEPIDLVGSNYGEPATPAAPYAAHASATAPVVEHKNDLIRAIHLNQNAMIWGSVNYGNNTLGLEVDLNKTPYLYYSFSKKASSKFTFALINDTANTPWITFLDSRMGGATFNSGNENWDAAGGAQYFTESATGCIDMRQFQYDKNVQRWIVNQVNFYHTDGSAVMVNYLFFGSAAIGGESATALDALVDKANALSFDGMTSESVNAFRSARRAARSVDRHDAAAVARAYHALAETMAELTAPKTTEVNTSGLVSIKKYSLSPSNWTCGDTTKESTSSEAYVTTQSTSTGLRFRRSSNCPHTWPSLINKTSYTVQPYGGVYLKLDADMDTAWTIALTVKQDGFGEVRVRLNAGIVNSYHNVQADNYYGVYQNVYDISDSFRMYGLDPTATFTVTAMSMTVVGSGSGWCYYNHLELLTGPSTSANYYDLEDTIAYAKQLTKSKYTSSSWSALQSALSVANTAMSTAGLTQPKINLAKHRLQSALDALEYASYVEPYRSLLAEDVAAWHTNQNLAKVYRDGNGDTVVENTNGSWSSADHLFVKGRRTRVADHQLEMTVSVKGNANFQLLVEGEWISISKYITSNRNGEDIFADDYTVKIPLTAIFGEDRAAVVIEGVRVWSVGGIGENAVVIHRMLIDDLDTFKFNNSLTTYGVAATPSVPAYRHAAKNGPTVTHKTDVLAACGLDHPTFTNGINSYGMQDMHLTVDLTKTPYLYYSIVQADSSRATFAIQSENTYVPFLVFADNNLGGGTLNKGADTWEAYEPYSHYVQGSITGCVDMRTLLKDSSATEWLIHNMTFYAAPGSEATFSYLYFGSAPLDNGYEEDPYTIGDVNDDGSVSTVDARMILGYVLGVDKNFTQTQMKAADFDCSGSLSTTDIRQMLQMIVNNK